MSPFKGWSSGDSKPLLELVFSPNEIEVRYKLKFNREKDDLDWYMGAHFNDNILGPIVMMRHENSPSNGTVIYIDSMVNVKEGLQRVKELLDIDDADIVWNAPYE